MVLFAFEMHTVYHKISGAERVQVWDFYLFWGDPALHHFVVLSFIIGNADVILQVIEQKPGASSSKRTP